MSTHSITDTVETLMYFNILGDVTLACSDPVDTADDHREIIPLDMSGESQDIPD